MLKSGQVSRRFTDVIKGIESAFKGAGMRSDGPPVRSILQTIERAFEQAGLIKSHDRSAPHSVVVDPVIAMLDSGQAPGVAEDAALDRPPASGRSMSGSFSNSAGSRHYQLYTPVQCMQKLSPLLVMLHGCTQSADDFAAGTRMNELADRFGMVVLYPIQEVRANGSKCWNWFRSSDQTRDSGEPSILAGMIRDLLNEHQIDSRRVYVAGFSAGAGMAAVLAETYPELFSKVGLHSGLRYRAATDVASAWRAMRSGVRDDAPGSSFSTPLSDLKKLLPTIVFQGDLDATVNPKNASSIVSRLLSLARNANIELKEERLARDAPLRGPSYTRTRFLSSSGVPQIDFWQLHQLGHAWSGGSAAGSFTDPSGPDASSEMVRFFID